MAQSTLDMLINVEVAGTGSVSNLRKELQELTGAASRKLSENGVSSRGMFESQARSQAYRIALQETGLQLTQRENLFLAGQRIEMQKNAEEQIRMNELSKIAWEISEGKNISVQTAYKRAVEELAIRKLIEESMMAAEAGLSTRKVNNGSLGEGPFSALYISGQEQVENGNYQLEESFNILASAIERINFESQETNDLFQKMAREQSDIIIKNNKMANMTDEQRIALGGLAVQADKSATSTLRMKDAEKMNLDIARQSYLNLQSGNLTVEESVRLAKEKIIQDYAFVESENAKAAATKLSTREMGAQRMQLMQLSIGMFVLGITTTQTFAALANMVGKTTELGQVFTEMGNSFKLLLGPMQIFLALQQLMIAQNKALLLQAMPVMLFFGSLYLLWKAFTTESPKVRAALGAIGGALMGLTAIMMYNTWAKWQNTIADLANKSIATGGAYLPAGLAIIAGAIAGGVALMATMPKAQTVDGYLRPINRTGIFYGHKGETVGRVGSMTPTTNNRSLVVNINVASGGSLDRGMIPQLSREIEMAVASGNGA